jgi:hypothetical protein
VKMLEDVTDTRKLETLDLGWARDSDIFFMPSNRIRFENLKRFLCKLDGGMALAMIPQTHLFETSSLCAAHHWKV